MPRSTITIANRVALLHAAKVCRGRDTRALRKLEHAVNHISELKLLRQNDPHTLRVEIHVLLTTEY